MRFLVGPLFSSDRSLNLLVHLGVCVARCGHLGGDSSLNCVSDLPLDVLLCCVNVFRNYDGVDKIS